ncbi:MAG: hypothetical protein IJE74_08885 [Clostridia bacterium]|nr:hypothetical protein [Clostridia bacterium]
MKKIIAILMAGLMVFAFTACNDGTQPEEKTTKESVSQEQNDNEEVSVGTDITESNVPNAETSDVSAETTTEPAVTVPSEKDPSEWTDEEIVAFYKAAAIKSKTKVTSKQTMTLREMVVNDGDGFLGKLVEMITPFLISALEDSSTEFDGITGGYENLELSDAQSVKAYKSGEYIVVEMTMKEQIDGAHGDLHSGTVGHAISVVGDLAVVEEALPNFEIGFDEAEVKLHYKNPKFKAKINKDGIIEKGTWTYEVYVTIKNLYVGGRRLPLSATVKSGYGTVDYIITVGGGF